MNRYRTGVLLVLISASSFALMPILAVYAYKGEADLYTVLFLRFALASLLLFAYLFYRKKPVAVKLPLLLKLVFIGAVLYTLQSSLYFASVKYIPVSLQALFFYTYPVFVAIIAIVIYKERLNLRLVTAIAVALTGMCLVIGTSFHNINLPGAFLALGAAVVYAIYLNLSNRVLKEVLPDVATAYISLSATAAFLVMGSITHSLNFSFQPAAWFPIVGIALFSTAIAILTLFRGMELLGSTRASILSIVEPLVTITISSLLFHDRLSAAQWVGGLLVLAGAFIVIQSRGQTKENQPVSGTEPCRSESSQN
ncbi:DMT family transporter [Syntrophomonas curvata]